MKYVVIVKELGKEYSRYQEKEIDAYKTVYEQSFEEVDVSELAVFLNTKAKRPKEEISCPEAFRTCIDGTVYGGEKQRAE